MVLLPPLPTRSLVLFLSTSLPSGLRMFALSSLLPTDMAVRALRLPLVLRGTLLMFVTWSLCGDCLPARNVAKPVVLMGVHDDDDDDDDDYCAIAPAEMAEVLHPLLTKCALRVQEPLAHKCGIAVDLWKGRGDHSLMKWYRSLLLSSVVQKHHDRFMRGRLMVLLGAVSLTHSVEGSAARAPPLPPWVCVVLLPPPVLAVSVPWPCLWT